MSAPSYSLFDLTGFSDRQYYGMLVTRITGSFLSLIGSLCIIRMANRKSRDQFYHRLMLVLSATDAISSFVYIWSPFVMPADSGFPLTVLGSESPCSAVAFIYHVFYSSTSVLTAFLALSFVSIVRYNMNNQRLAQLYEKPAYVLTIALSIVAPILGVINGAFRANPISSHCSWMDYPPGCSTSAPNTCIKGSWTRNLSRAQSAIRGSATVVAVISVLLTLWTVYRTSRKQLSYSFGTTTARDSRSQMNVTSQSLVGGPNRLTNSSFRAAPSSEIASSIYVGAPNPTISAAEEAHNLKMRQLCKRSCLYVLAYFNSIIWNGLGLLFTKIGKNVSFNLGSPGWYMFLTMYQGLIPLQGAINFLIYSSPSVSATRKKHDKVSWFVIVYHLVANDGEHLRQYASKESHNSSTVTGTVGSASHHGGTPTKPYNVVSGGETGVSAVHLDSH